jgi:lipopolysaccharide transport system ATP-binding protein
MGLDGLIFRPRIDLFCFCPMELSQAQGSVSGARVTSPQYPICLTDVSKRYRRPSDKPLVTSLKGYLTHDLWRFGLKAKPKAPMPEDEANIWAVRDVSFFVPQGRTLGVIGRNGSGKSTLLKLLGRILGPDKGCVAVQGKVAALIELGAGFHPELTGKENIMINGMIMGLSKAEMRARMGDIIAFAELGSFIDYPVRTYSSGMYARLGFAVAMHVDPDILLIDEVLSVGDATFTAKCHDALNTFRARGKCIVVVSHDLHTIGTWCDEAIWMDAGQIQQQGPAAEVVAAYQARFASM